MTRTFSVNKSNIKDPKELAKIAKKIGFREFNEVDWFNYGGSAKFNDGSEPLILRTDKITIVIDRYGILIEGNDHWVRATLTDIKSGEF